MTEITQHQWDFQPAAHPGHLLQSRRWGQLKSQFGWISTQIKTEDAAARLLFRQLPLGFSIGYIPKGPVVNWNNHTGCDALFAKVHAAAKKHRAVFLKIEPDSVQSSLQKNPAARYLQQAGFKAADTIQPRTSIVIDISGNEDFILAAMKQKTRYNIRLAQRKGVTVRQGNLADVPQFHQLSQLTAGRDGFGIHRREYYQAAFQLFAPDHCALLFAEFKGEPLAALMVFSHGSTAFYFYGASSNTHRNLMPTYLVQWEAIRWAKARGCTRYDLWGIPDADADTLEAEFPNRHDGLWGVYRFKRGFGGQIVQSVGAFDYVYNPLLHKLYKLRRGV